MWVSFFVVACLAHALLIIPAAALARFDDYEPKPKDEEEVFELDLFPPPPPAPVAQRDETDDVPAPKPTTPKPKPEPRAPPGAKPKPDQPKPPPPGNEVPEEVPDENLVEAPDGALSQPSTATDKSGDWGKLGGSTDALQDTFGTRERTARPAPPQAPSNSMLDNKAHLFSSFFGRMRRRVLEHWDVDKAVQRNDPEGRQLGGISRTTRALVQISRDGKIEKVTVERRSNVDYLDAEAIRALKAAGPFPNPPPGLFEGADSFAFLVDFTVLPDGSARIFRSR